MHLLEWNQGTLSHPQDSDKGLSNCTGYSDKSKCFLYNSDIKTIEI